METEQHKRTKIVCTIGPASQDIGMLRAMIRAGMDVARINFSHGEHEVHARNMANIRHVAEEEGKVVAILADLPGPKLRLGNLGQDPLDRPALHDPDAGARERRFYQPARREGSK